MNLPCAAQVPACVHKARRPRHIPYSAIYPRSQNHGSADPETIKYNRITHDYVPNSPLDPYIWAKKRIATILQYASPLTGDADMVSPGHL